MGSPVDARAPSGFQSSMTDRITLRRADDWHVHLRDGAMLAAVVP